MDTIKADRPDTVLENERLGAGAGDPLVEVREAALLTPFLVTALLELEVASVDALLNMLAGLVSGLALSSYDKDTFRGVRAVMELGRWMLCLFLDLEKQEVVDVRRALSTLRRVLGLTILRRCLMCADVHMSWCVLTLHPHVLSEWMRHFVVICVPHPALVPMHTIHMQGSRVSRSTYRTAWAVCPRSGCQCSYSYGQGPAIGPHTGRGCFRYLTSVWRALEPLLSPWCADGEVPSAANLNLYGGSRSHVSWHCDDEPLFGGIGDPKLIVSLSLGSSVT